ncbi:MAG TPA: HAD-IB family hydrolase, partial [Rubrobacteraceae bacterium]|nr:HAD-IB family hydrolase [Rubrobacteraceae bacterium]
YASGKVRILEGDVHAPSLGLGDVDLAELSREVDIVIHSAASVVFDAPLDAAVDSNVHGTLGLLGLAREWEKRPLFMHISTAYVAGNSTVDAPELPPGSTSPNGTLLDARAEVSSLEAVVREVEEASRERGLSRRFETEARRELGMVGEEDEVAGRVDQLRRAWMRERLVERGTERAQELGWNDVYTFTKSLAERMVLLERGETPTIILRPAIIESSHREPYPGWIQGTRMADPIIMAFAKGILREFPGDPNSYVDIVPVDHVVNAILAAGVRRPEEPEVFQVASGERNPLRYRGLYDIVRGYFLENPLRDSGGRPVQVPEWSFPGRKRVEGQLKLELAGLKVAGKVAARMPEGHMAHDARQRIARAEKRARMSLYYSRIYGAYANMTATFSTARTKALYEALPAEDREEFPFDITQLDWREWLQGAHLPALTTRPNRKKRKKAADEKPGEIAAIFDVDGTLVGSNVVSYFAWIRMQELPPVARPFWLAAFLTKVPYYWGLDKISRAHFNRAFYKNYAGWKPARAKHLGQESFHGFTLERMFPDALQQLRDHKAAGHRVVLLSGALDFLLEPMKDLVDDVLCATLAQENGVYTGELSGAPVAGDARARMLASFARRRNLDLSKSYAYADSISDLPMLEAVGNPVAVNPDRRLETSAKERGWRIERWGKNSIAKKV